MEELESKITVTIDVKTWQGYHNRRVIEVEPGIGWSDRALYDFKRVASEMEEEILGLVRRETSEADHEEV